jgi:type II secretory pathway pseudopilin PulG
MRLCHRSSDRGFSLVDLLAVIGIIATVLAIAVPGMLGAMERVRLGQSARQVERELQTAKSRAVVKGRAMRVRFNCPAAGQYRAVELLGTPFVPLAADAAADRCSETTYPYPPADNNPLTTPNLDGPLRRLDQSVSFGTARTIEFRADGTAYYDTGTAVFSMVPVAGIQLQLVRDGATRTITVNGLGRIQLQQ